MKNLVFGNLDKKFELITDYWDPHIVAELNGQYVKLAKVRGEFDMHFHENEDELFYVYKGKLEMQLEDQIQIVGAGEFIVIPRGVKHKPIAKEETWILLFEPMSTLNTGEINNQYTKSNLKKI